MPSLILKENQTMSVKQKAAGSGMQVIVDGAGKTSVELCLPSPAMELRICCGHLHNLLCQGSLFGWKQFLGLSGKCLMSASVQQMHP